jgi:hypothetical protein
MVSRKFKQLRRQKIARASGTKRFIFVALAVSGLVSVVARQATADTFTPPPSNPLVNFSGFATGQIQAISTTNGGTFEATTPVSSPSPPCGCFLPIGVTVGPVASDGSPDQFQAGRASAGGSVSSQFIPSTANNLSGDVNLQVQGSASVLLPSVGPNAGSSGTGIASTNVTATIAYYMAIAGPTGQVWQAAWYPLSRRLP